MPRNTAIPTSNYDGFHARGARKGTYRLNLLEAGILGVVEGITEFLPISSTGHLVIASALLGLNEPADVKRSVDAFNIVIQGGAILAVAGLFWPRIVQMMRGASGRDPVGLKLFINLLVAFVPAAVFGLLLDDWIESHLFHPTPVMAALAAGGVVMIALGPWQRRRFHESNADSPGPAFTTLEELSWRQALVIGLLQCVAMWPGTSRSLMTIVGGILVGLSAKAAVEYSFLLGVLTLSAATFKKALWAIEGAGAQYDVWFGGTKLMLDHYGSGPFFVGIIAAAVSAAFAVKWLVSYLQSHGLEIFGYYRIALGLIVGTLLLTGII